MGNALIYESLLCEAHNCDRHGANGAADADVYRKLEHAIRAVELQKAAIENKEMPISALSVDDLEHEVRVEIGKIKNNLLQALREINRKTHSESKREKLRDLMRRLTPAEETYTKENIDYVIDEAWKMVKEKNKYHVTLSENNTGFANGWQASIARVYMPDDARNAVVQGESLIYSSKDKAWDSINKRVEKLDYDNNEILFNRDKVESFEAVLSLMKDL